MNSEGCGQTYTYDLCLLFKYEGRSTKYVRCSNVIIYDLGYLLSTKVEVWSTPGEAVSFIEAATRGHGSCLTNHPQMF